MVKKEDIISGCRRYIVFRHQEKMHVSGQLISWSDLIILSVYPEDHLLHGAVWIQNIAKSMSIDYRFEPAITGISFCTVPFKSSWLKQNSKGSSNMSGMRQLNKGYINNDIFNSSSVTLFFMLLRTFCKLVNWTGAFSSLELIRQWLTLSIIARFTTSLFTHLC